MPRIRQLLWVAALVGCGDAATEPLGSHDDELSAERIAFASTRGGDWPHIYTVDADGADPTRVALGSSPAWSFDGRRIAFYRPANPYDRAGIYVASADGSNEEFLSPARHAAWAPDGSIAAAGNFGIVVVDGGTYRSLLDRDWMLAAAGEPCDPEEPYSRSAAASPAWSPDGAQITFLLTCTPGGESTGGGTPFVLDIATGLPRRLLDWETMDAGPPAWSPDGSHVALTVEGWLTILDLASGGTTSYDLTGYVDTVGQTVDWSPNGRDIAFEAGAPDMRRIFIMSLDGTVVRRLIADTSGDFYRDFDVAWSRVR